MRAIRNKKGDIATIIYAVVMLFIVGIVLFFVSHLNQEIYTELQDELNTTYNGTEAMTVLDSWKDSDYYIWDYAFLGVFFGVLVALGLTAYAVKISPIFYWVYGIMSLVVLATGVMLSNIWQDMAADPEFSTTITRFSITNAILGSYFPLVIVAIILIAMIIIFGKPFGQEESYL